MTAQSLLEGMPPVTQEDHLAQMDAAWAEHVRLTEWCNANIPDYFNGKSTLIEKKLYDERWQAGEKAKRDFFSAAVRFAMARAALSPKAGS